jgi:hypothetical protein
MSTYYLESRLTTTHNRYGLPEPLFDHSLGWLPPDFRTNLRRRLHSGRLGVSELGPSKLPSWSWIGWQGPLEFDNAQDYGWMAMAETIPIATWSIGDSPNDPKPRGIRSSGLKSFHESRRLKSLKTLVDDDITLPPNQILHDCVLRYNRSEELVITRPKYRDIGDPTNPQTHPFPLPKTGLDGSVHMPKQSCYLFGETQRTHMVFQADKEGGNPNSLLVFSSTRADANRVICICTIATN